MNPTWKQTMDKEMNSLLSQGSWDFVTAPPRYDIVSCEQVFTMKYRHGGKVDIYKAHLVAKGFTQTCEVDYFETFSPVACLNFICVIFCFVINQQWPMFQLDGKNTLYGDLWEEVCMEQPLWYVAQGESIMCKLKKVIYGLK